MKIGLVTVGSVAHRRLAMVRQILTSMDYKITKLPGLSPSDFTLIKATINGAVNVTEQLDGDKIIDRLHGCKSTSRSDVYVQTQPRYSSFKDTLLAITDHDLGAMSRTFMFGYAHMKLDVVVVSLHRLGQLGPRLRRQLTKSVLVHELGHTRGLPHCGDRGCVMQPVGDIESLRKLPQVFCRNCVEKCADALQRAAAGS